jgi:hypothetical protein
MGYDANNVLVRKPQREGLLERVGINGRRI